LIGVNTVVGVVAVVLIVALGWPRLQRRFATAKRKA
jgi:hypothetical protein